MKTFLPILSLLIGVVGYSQTDSTILIGFYNLENLFDTIHDQGKKDYEYLPHNSRAWNTPKYQEKLNHLARSIASMNNWIGPDLLGICEIENRICLVDLVETTNLNRLGYEVIHQESSDERGIDVACIYKKGRLKLIEYKFISIQFKNLEKKTRDILHAKFQVEKGDTFHIFVNHWPSRFGGQLKSENKRKYVATVLKQQTDSILQVDASANILVLGDFNDGPEDESILKSFGASNDSISSFFNTSLALYKEGKGSHKFQEEWNLFDQVIISKSLMNNHSLRYVARSSKIHNDKEWLSEPDLIYGGQKPYRSFYGKTYIGGYSDHYAVSLKLNFSLKH